MRALALLAALALTGCQSMPERPAWWPTVAEPDPSRLLTWGHELAHAVHGAWHGEDERDAGPGAQRRSFTLKVMEVERPDVACRLKGAWAHEGAKVGGCTLYRYDGVTLIVPRLFREAP